MLVRRAREPLAILAARRVGDEPEHRPALCFPFANGMLQPVAVAPRDYHGRAVLGQPRPDLGADPAASAGDDRDLAVERALHRLASVPPPTAPSTRSRPAGSSIECPPAPSTMRRSRPESTRPAPTSTNAVAPSAASRSTHSVHRTGLATWRIRKGRTSAALRVTPASTLRTTGTAGSAT